MERPGNMPSALAQPSHDATPASSVPAAESVDRAYERFAADLESGRRILAMAEPSTKQSVFLNVAREAVRWHSLGLLPKPDVVDGLREMGLSAGLDDVDIQQALVSAVDDPFVPSTPAISDVAAPASLWRARCSNAADLQRVSFPPVSYVIPGLLPEGLALLAGKPKIGKSWLALDLCLGVAAGGPSLGLPAGDPGDVLYIALEDNQRRLQRRIGRLMGERLWPERLTLATEWPRLDKGGVEDVASWVNSVKSPRLVVVDTLAGIKPLHATAGYADDYAALAGLHRLANSRCISVLVLHHTRKMSADDPIDTVSGTLGLSGCADTILVLARSSGGVTVYCRGRDIEEAEHAANFDAETCRWSLTGSAAEMRRSPERQLVRGALAPGEMSVVDLVAATGMTRRNLEKLLHFMVRDGEVVRIARGLYGPVAG